MRQFLKSGAIGLALVLSLANARAVSIVSASPQGEVARVRQSDRRVAASSTIGGLTQFGVSTGGPAVLSVQPGQGDQIDVDQHFLLRLSGPAVEASVLANAWCEVEGIGERMGVRVVGGDLRAQLLKLRHVDPKDAARVLFITCPRPLPSAAAVRLVWGKGIAAAANPKVLTGIEQRFRYTVRPAFTAEFTCERERVNAPCLPIRPMTVRFSRPIERDARLRSCRCSHRAAIRLRRGRPRRQKDRSERSHLREAAASSRSTPDILPAAPQPRRAKTRSIAASITTLQRL